MATKGLMVMDKFERKVTKIGNSLGLTLPQDVYNKLNIGQGDVMSIEVREDDGVIEIRKKQQISMPEGVNPRFLEALNKTINKFDGAFKDLVER